MNIKQGDIFKLGPHTLGCGSSMDSEFVDKVMEVHKEKVRVILTDPPYGVAYVEGKKDFAKLGKENVKKIQNDHIQTDEEYKIFTSKWLDPIKKHLTPYNAYYIFNSDIMFPSLREGLSMSGFYYSQMLVWVKNTVVVGRKDFLPMHEVIAYGWHGKHKMEQSKAKSVINHPKPAKAKLHPTMKPIGLLRKLIPNSAKVNETIYDPFGGSGSTLIACEHLKRNCVMIELDHEYIATIIERWEILTGAKAKKI